jgi:hypothetical protein
LPAAGILLLKSVRLIRVLERIARVLIGKEFLRDIKLTPSVFGDVFYI